MELSSHIFYFEPDHKWYLIAQAEYEDRYTPIYSTTTNISDPSSWSNAQILVDKFESDKWIDFWVICDNSTSYLFYLLIERIPLPLGRG